QVFHRETRQLVVSALVRPAPDGKSAAMIITLPLGLNLTEPVLVKVDSSTAERQSIQTCTNVGCFVAMTLTDKLIAAMRAGSDLKITVQDANKKPIEMSLPLLGFGIAFDKAKWPGTPGGTRCGRGFSPLSSFPRLQPGRARSRREN